MGDSKIRPPLIAPSFSTSIFNRNFSYFFMKINIVGKMNMLFSNFVLVFFENVQLLSNCRIKLTCEIKLKSKLEQSLYKHIK